MKERKTDKVKFVINEIPEIPKYRLFPDLLNGNGYLKRQDYFELQKKIIEYKNKGSKSLNLTSLRFDELPEELFKLHDLESLTLSSCGLKTIPEEIQIFKNLRTLNLNNNHIKELPASIYSLKWLETLYLRLNNLSDISGLIGNLSNLKLLDLSRNKISNIPTEIGDLLKLNELNFYKNRISSIPESIGKLDNLQLFDISHNKISEIPEAVTLLSNLKRFSVVGNKVNHIPNNIVKLTKLQHFGYEPLNLPEESLFRDFGLAEIREILKSEGIKKSIFPLPQELRNAFQKYFSGFDEFFKDIKGKEITFNVKKIEEGLEFEIIYDGKIDTEEIEEAFQNFVQQLVRNEPLIHAYSEVEYNKVELAKLEMKQQAEIFGFQQQIKVLEVFNQKLASEVNNLIKTLNQQDKQLLVLSTQNKLLSKHNKNLVDVAKKPVIINNNFQIVNQLDNLLNNLSKLKELPEEIYEDYEKLKDTLQNSDDNSIAKKQTKSFFRKLLDFIKDVKTITKDTEDVGKWFVEKYEYIEKKVNGLTHITPEIFKHFEQLIMKNLTNDF